MIDLRKLQEKYSTKYNGRENMKGSETWKTADM